MSKKHFIALANAIRKHQANAANGDGTAFTDDQLVTLAFFCKQQNPAFMSHRWRDYIDAKCGPNGGTVKQ